MRKRGFTLIELLAVIVILAIIALIATPIVMNIIDDSKKSATERSTENYIRALENAIMIERMKGNFNPSSCSISNDNEKSIAICDGIKLDVETSGIKPESGYIEIENSKVLSYNIKTNGKVSSSIKDEDFKVWDGSQKEPILDGNTYHINEAAELAWVASQTNSGNTFLGKTISLEDNIDLNSIDWVPIGTLTNSFSGSFDGNGYTVKNLYIKKEGTTNSDKAIGLFGAISISIDDSIDLSNVTITNSSIKGYSGIGGFIGIIKGNGGSISINNLNSYNNAIEGQSYVGGIIGSISLKNATISGINVYSNIVKGSEIAGGLLGYIRIDNDDNIVGKISDCFVDSNTIVNVTSYISGGIVGYVYQETVIDNCISYATLKSTSDYCGGIVGYLADNSAIINSKSYSKVQGKSNVGGIVGYSSLASGIENSEDYSDIEGESKVGSICGEFYNSEGYVKNTFSSGTVNGNKTNDNTLFGVTPNPTYIILENVYVK